MSMPGGPFAVGDVVYSEGSSAILGDVIAIEEEELDGAGELSYQYVVVRWRVAETTEDSADLILAETGNETEGD